ncbi:flavin reductase family protein [Streptomyces sp. NPDC006798]|uniref:flavin reductase family protein n=1 Tax=Streptomyces sp. NPDC006798 TaxID=3155462 RepID=UPI0033CD026E
MGPTSSAPAGARIAPAVLRGVLREVPTAVTVVTAATRLGPAGLTVGSFVSVSLRPPLVGVFIDEKSTSWREMRTAPTFAVNVLAGDQQELCARFASSGTDKFAGLSYGTSPSGNPLLPGAAAWLDCRIEDVRRLGDHDFVLARVAALGTASAGSSIVFHRGTLRAIP